MSHRSSDSNPSDGDNHPTSHAHRGHNHPQPYASTSNGAAHNAYDPFAPPLHHSNSEPTHPSHPFNGQHSHLSQHHPNSPSPSPVRPHTGHHHLSNQSHSASPHPAIPVHAHETSPLDHSMRSLRLHPGTLNSQETEILRARARQFGRLVAGYEGSFNGEAPPDYEVAVAQDVNGHGTVGSGSSGPGMPGAEAERGRQRGRGAAIQVN